MSSIGGSVSVLVGKIPASVRIVAVVALAAGAIVVPTVTGGSDGGGSCEAADGCFPDSTNTGYQNAPGYPGSLTTASSGSATCPTTIQSNHTYSFCSYEGGVDVGLAGSPVSNVTFIGCRVRASNPESAITLVRGDNITFSYCTFQPNVAAPPVAYADSYQYALAAGGQYTTGVQKFTVENCDIWGFGNAIDTFGSTQAKPQVFRDNWIHDAAADGGSYHTDGIGSLSGAGTGSYVVIDHNTIEATGNTNGIAFQQGSYDHYTITNNLFGGFGYTIALWAASGSGTNTTFTDNTFSTRLPVMFGPLYPQAFWTATGSVWARNKWKVPGGASWGNPVHDDWFWVPNTTANGGSSDTPFVSSSDYAG